MRIIQIMPEFGLAGAEIMCESLMYELKKMGNEVYAVSLYDYHSAITERLEHSGIKVFYLNKTPGLDIGIIRKLTHLFKVYHPDVVHTHRYVMKYVLPAAKITKIEKIVHTVHNVAEKENFKRDRFFYHMGYKVGGVIPVALSEEVRDTVLKVYGLKKKDVPIVYNGINLKKYRKKTDYSFGNEIKLLHIGRFAEAKNHKNLIKIFKKLSKEFDTLKLYLIGEGPFEQNIRKQVKDLKLENKVIFVGTTDQISQYLYSSDIFVLPSLFEGMPMTLIEAMASALPIVTTCVGGITSMLTHNVEGLLSEPDNEKIYHNIKKMLIDESLRKKCGLNALKKSSLFSSEMMAKQYLEIYSGIVISNKYCI